MVAEAENLLTKSAAAKEVLRLAKSALKRARKLAKVSKKAAKLAKKRAKEAGARLAGRSKPQARKQEGAQGRQGSPSSAAVPPQGPPQVGGETEQRRRT